MSGLPPSPRRVYKLTDYRSVLAAAGDLDAQAILVGGQAVYFWATRYFDRFPELEAFLPFTSQDADYLAEVPAAQELARHLKSRFCPSPTKGGMLGLSLGDIPLGDDMKVEILGRINGVKNDDVRAAALVIGWQNLEVQVIHPAQLYIGKGCNLLGLDQADRQDGKHFGIMQWVMRGFLADLAQTAVHDDPRPFLDCCEHLMRFAIGREGIKLIDLGHMALAGLWPGLEGHPSAKVRRFAEERVPRWERQVAALVEKRRALMQSVK